MAKGPRYRVPFRRRKEGKTNYRSRRALVLSRVPRLVVRGTLRHMVVQVIDAKAMGDEVLVSAHSGELMKAFGWRGDCGNVSAGYLTGLLCGHRAVDRGLERAVLDIGLQSPSPGARVFAALKGALDAGVVVPHSEIVLPDEKRIRGEHVAGYANHLSSNPDTYQQRFSKYLSRSMHPEQLPKHFSLVKEKIVSAFERKNA